MTKKFAGLFGSSQWLMDRAAMQGLVHRLEALTPDALHAAEAQARAYAAGTEPKMVGDVAVIPICGPIFYKPSWYAMYFGGAVLTTIRAQFKTALNDPNVSAVVFCIDSPGGIIDMVPEFAKELFAARGKKPLIAVADTMIASAAYWIAAQADQIVVTESSRVGSIGVFAEHEDVSGMLERLGVKVTLIAYGEHKVDGNPYEPLSDAARAKIQEDITKAGKKFEAAVARGRGLTTKVVQGSFGQGQMFDGDAAIELRMADTIGSLEQVLARPSKTRGRVAAAVAEAEPTTITAAAAVSGATASSDAEPAEYCDPDGDGNCPDGYEKGDDGRCHLVTPAEVEARAAAADEQAILAALVD